MNEHLSFIQSQCSRILTFAHILVGANRYQVIVNKIVPKEIRQNLIDLYVSFNQNQLCEFHHTNEATRITQEVNELRSPNLVRPSVLHLGHLSKSSAAIA